MSDECRVEPPFQLQGSCRSVARLAEKILRVMNDDEVAALLDDRYGGEAQALTSVAESKLLKLQELRDTLNEVKLALGQDSTPTFMRIQRNDAGEDPMLLVAGSLVDFGELVKDGLALKWDMGESG